MLNEIGITQKNLGRYTEALNTYSRGLDIAREIKDTSGASFLALNLAVLHDTIGETELGVERGLEALTLTRESGNRRGESIVLENLASEYWSLGNQERAIESLQSVLRVTREMGTRNQEGIVLRIWATFTPSAETSPLRSSGTKKRWRSSVRPASARAWRRRWRAYPT